MHLTSLIITMDSYWQLGETVLLPAFHVPAITILVLLWNYTLEKGKHRLFAIGGTNIELNNSDAWKELFNAFGLY